MLNLLALGASVPSCFAPDPPEYQSPIQTPPVLALNRAEPGVTEIVEGAIGVTIDFTVGVRSEDAGDSLVGSAFLNYGSENEEHQAEVLRNASVFADTSRSIDFKYTPQGKPGCHVMVLLVTHLGNYDIQENKPRDFQDVALATWWLRVGDPPDCTFGGG